MKLLFVTSNRPASRLIRWGLKSDCSHFAVCFDEQAKGSGIVFHSAFGGATLEWFGTFKQHNHLVHALQFKSPMNLQDEESVYQGMLSTYSGQGYDRWAFGFWFIRAAMRRFFGMALPPKNSWAKAGFNLCTGMAAGIKWIKVWADENKIDLEMIAPHDLKDRLVATGYFYDDRVWCDLQNTNECQ